MPSPEPSSITTSRVIPARMPAESGGVSSAPSITTNTFVLKDDLQG